MRNKITLDLTCLDASVNRISSENIVTIRQEVDKLFAQKDKEGIPVCALTIKVENLDVEKEDVDIILTFLTTYL